MFDATPRSVVGISSICSVVTTQLGGFRLGSPIVSGPVTGMMFCECQNVKRSPPLVATRVATREYSARIRANRRLASSGECERRPNQATGFHGLWFRWPSGKPHDVGTRLPVLLLEHGFDFCSASREREIATGA